MQSSVFEWRTVKSQALPKNERLRFALWANALEHKNARDGERSAPGNHRTDRLKGLLHVVIAHGPASHDIPQGLLRHAHRLDHLRRIWKAVKMGIVSGP
jgi:hypothetical protein